MLKGLIILKNQKLERELERNTVNIRAIMRSSSDLNIKYARAGQVNICAVSCEGQVDTNQIANLIYRPIGTIGNEKKLTPQQVSDIIRTELLLAVEQKQIENYDDLVSSLMNGFCVILTDGVDNGIAVGVQGFKTRSVSEPLNHQNIRGSREGFVEAVRTNMSIVRRRVKSPDLVFRLDTAGSLTNTDICICYIEKRADKRLVEDVTRRLKSLPLSVILESGYIQPFLDEKNMLFAETGATERPDVFVSKLYEGRVGVLVDGTPFALIIPKLFTENFMMLDDYTERPVFASLMRFMRYFAFFIAVLLPGFFVAVADFNPELIPDALLLNIASSIAITPYNLLTECIVMSVFYEIMRESGLRMPANVGHAVSIVGGIVIGDIVISAGLAGAHMLLVIAIASVASFIVPDLYNAIVVMRFVFILAGGLFGLFGITAAGLLFCIKLCSMNAYGIPFTVPLSPFSPKNMRDTFIRMGWRFLAKSDSKIQNMNGVEIKSKIQ